MLHLHPRINAEGLRRKRVDGKQQRQRNEMVLTLVLSVVFRMHLVVRPHRVRQMHHEPQVHKGKVSLMESLGRLDPRLHRHRRRRQG